MYRRFRQEQTSIYSEEQVKRVLSESGIHIESEVDSDFIIFCPYHNNYRTPAGEVSKDRGTFFCFSCHESKPLVELVIHMTQKSYFEAMRFIESKKTETDIMSSIDKILDNKSDFVPFDELLIRRLNNQALLSSRAMSYFEQRKINVDSIKKFFLGYSENQDMVTVPILSPDGQMFLGFVARSIEGKEFKNTPNLPKSKTLFNLHRIKMHDTVYVVESSFDAIRLDQCGIPAVSTLGANVPKTQIELLTKNFNNVIIIPDNDAAGQDMVKRIVDKIGPRATAIGIPSRFKDIGDMNDEDINILTKKINDPLLSIIG